MDARVEIITPDVGRPFRAFAHAAKDFPTYWHRHAEYELVFGTAGGELRIDDVIEPIATPRMLLLGPQVPHAWTEHQPYEHVVVQFRRDWLGVGFLQTSGCEQLAALLDRAATGLVIEGAPAVRLATRLRAVLPLSGVAAIVGLLGCLDAFGAANPRAVLMAGTTNSVDQRLRAILTWIDQHAAEEIALSDAAAQADMHPQAFARYFRKATGHSFVGYLGHVRVRNACQLLPDRARSVTAIALDVGFGTVANFNRTFRRLRRMTPSAYRSRSSA